MEKLNVWNKLEFKTANEYYETLGFLSKEEEFIRMYIENNKASGAGGDQQRLSLRKIDKTCLPEALKRAFNSSSDNRLSVGKYISYLHKEHGFTHIEVSSGKGRVQSYHRVTLEQVLDTVPEKNIDDFWRGYNWNCGLIKKIHSNSDKEINFDFETICAHTKNRCEGRKVEIYSTKYERSTANRADALHIHGTKCMICGFNFEDIYGDLGKNYIEVHHIKPLSTLEEEININPETDLICVCANCHRMMHRYKDFIITPEELRQIVESKKK